MTKKNKQDFYKHQFNTEEKIVNMASECILLGYEGIKSADYPIMNLGEYIDYATRALCPLFVYYIGNDIGLGNKERSNLMHKIFKAFIERKNINENETYKPEPLEHPGAFIKRRFLCHSSSQRSLARGLDISQARLSNLLSGKNGISTKMAIKLGDYFHISPDYFLKIQDDYSLAVEQAKISVKGE